MSQWSFNRNKHTETQVAASAWAFGHAHWVIFTLPKPQSIWTHGKAHAKYDSVDIKIDHSVEEIIRILFLYTFLNIIKHDPVYKGREDLKDSVC